MLYFYGYANLPVYVILRSVILYV